MEKTCKEALKKEIMFVTNETVPKPVPTIHSFSRLLIYQIIALLTI